MIEALLAYSYIRFSSRKQEEGDSLRRQMALAEEWSARTGIPLDKSRKWHDLGRSAFLGEHRHNPDRNALAAFLKMVEDGRIAKGSYLLIESFDRLTREDIQPALTLVLNLLQAGIRVVQLTPEMTFDSKSDALAIIVMIVELRRGNSESALKSERVGKAWREKKRKAAEDNAPIGDIAPSWVRLDGDEYKLIPGAAAAVRHVFHMARDGCGMTVIAKKMNDGFPPITGKAGGSTGHKRRGKFWHRSYIAKILNNRAALGEYQPHTGSVGPKRKPVGPPIKGYYPAVISEDEWHGAHAGLAQRKNKPGRPPARAKVNLFSGLIFDATTGGPMHYGDKDGPVLIPYKGIVGIGARTTFPSVTFERAVLSCLREIDPREIVPAEAGSTSADESMALAGRIAELQTEVDQIVASLNAKYSPTLDAVLRVKEDAKALLVEEQRSANREAVSPLPEAWGECKGVLATLDAAPDQEAARLKLRSSLRRIIERVTLLVVVRGAVRLAAAQIHFTGGGVRSYLIANRRGSGGAENIPRREATWAVRSLAHGGEGLDLRRQDHAPALAARLEAMDVEEVIAGR